MVMHQVRVYLCIILVVLVLAGNIADARNGGFAVSAIGGSELVTSQGQWVWAIPEYQCLEKGNVRVEYYIRYDDKKPIAYFDLISCDRVDLPNLGYLKLIPSVDGKQFIFVDLGQMGSKLNLFVSEVDNQIVIANCPQYGVKYQKSISLIQITDENWLSHKGDYCKNVNINK